MSTTTTEAPRQTGIAWTPLIWIGTFHVLALLAFFPQFFTWKALAACVVMHWVTGGLGITLAYHRLLTHRSFQFRYKWMEYFFTALGCAASEGGAVGWVADHRRHHAHSDEEDDVHSPNRGFGWAHMFWWMTPDITSIHTADYYEKWAPDLNRDPVHVWLDKYHYIFPLASLGLMYALGGLPWLVWGGFVRTVTVLHTTWLVNSATHVWGYRTHETRDKSTNLWWVALLTFGEGWHNNHHAFQTSARHGIRWWEVDMTWMTIWTMEKLGLAHSIKRPKLTHAAPVKSGSAAAVLAASRVKSRTDDETELVGSTN